MPTEKEEKALYQQIGGMASDITHIKDTVAVIADKVDSVVTTTAVLDKQAVKNPECTQRHVAIAQSLSMMKSELIAELKKGTGNYPSVAAITHAGAVQGAPGMAELSQKLDAVLQQPTPTFDEFRAQLDALTEQKTEKKRKTVQFFLAVILGSITLISALGACAVKVLSYMNAMQATMVQQTEQQREIQRELHKKPKVIYLKPDAGE